MALSVFRWRPWRYRTETPAEGPVSPFQPSRCMNAPFRVPKPKLAPRRRRLYPLPVESLADHPSVIAMPCSAAGMLFRLVLHFWMTECKPMPTSDGELKMIARAHTPTWITHRAEVIKVFQELRPEFEDYFCLRKKKTEIFKKASSEGGKRRAETVALQFRLARVSKNEADLAAGLTPMPIHKNAPTRAKERSEVINPRAAPDLKDRRQRFVD